MAILGEEDVAGFCDAVRKALDVSIEPSTLPDTTIQLGIYLGAAEAELLDRVDDADDSEHPDRPRVLRALTYLTAELLAPAVFPVTSLSAQTHDLSYSRQVFNPEKKAAELRARAEKEIARLLEPGNTDAGVIMPIFFSTAPGYRGR